MPNQSLCMSCRYGSDCADFIEDKDAFVVRCDKYQKFITNADKVRSMTDDELAQFIFNGCLNITNMAYCESGKDCCVSCWLEWLKSPVKEE